MSSKDKDTDLLGALVAIHLKDRAITVATKAQRKKVAHGIRVSRNALVKYLSARPPETTTLTLPRELTDYLVEIWASQYRWSAGGWLSLSDYIGRLLVDGDGAWDVTLEGTSNPDPRKEKEVSTATISVQRVTTR